MSRKILVFFYRHSFLSAFFIILIITIPSFLSLINNSYFSMHDDQHIARLFLLDKGIHQGYVYPRWVNWLGFGYGYPLFNFYPPLVYYVAEIFHLVGFSFIWSIKLTFIAGFILGAWGVYIFTRKRFGYLAGFVASTLYTFFFYHAVLIYVRGALAEFFAMAILPFVFFTISNLAENQDFKNSIYFALSFGLLILTHPLISFPALFYIFLFSVFYSITLVKDKKQFFKYSVLGMTLGLGLSAFFWLPSMVERKYTLVDTILTKELANYKIHFIYPQQFLYSLWGYGGSIAGPYDGLTFQLGKVHLFLILAALVLSLIFLFKKKFQEQIANFYFFLFLLIFSLFMTTSYSSFVWNRISYLWYLQFPWRFLTFAAIFISIGGAFFVFFSANLFKGKTIRIANFLITIVIIISTIGIYQKYFKPQYLINKTDTQLTSFDEIAWHISRTSFEFMPKGIATIKSETNTTIPDITKDKIVRENFSLISGSAEISTIGDKMEEKIWTISSDQSVLFRFNNFNFPGWKAYLDGRQTIINDNNKFKLITVFVPRGQHNLRIVFEDTPIRKIGDIISVLSVIFVLALLQKLKNKQASHYNSRSLI